MTVSAYLALPEVTLGQMGAMFHDGLPVSCGYQPIRVNWLSRLSWNLDVENDQMEGWFKEQARSILSAVGRRARPSPRPGASAWQSTAGLRQGTKSSQEVTHTRVQPPPFPVMSQ